ncbi:MAG: hypothetical protein KC416_04545, partial [Myxococcales bacterium]|nr:hypothetical protein [Myxococcales bacterium]
RILLQLAAAHGALEHHQEKITYLRKYNALFDPDLIAELAWPLMKLGRYGEARQVADAALASGDPGQEIVALNAMCATEFEAGNVMVSYEACKRALEHGRQGGSEPDVVDLTNFAEASRSVFRLDEAERILLEATKVKEISWYGSPWLELAELYIREAKLPQALEALKRHVPFVMQKPTHVREVDRNEQRRVLASLLLVAGQDRAAGRITSEAIVSPDRRAHTSRDPEQDLLVSAMLDRRVKLVAAERILERPTPWYGRPWRALRASWQRLLAWLSGRQARKLLLEKDRLVGSLRIGTRDAAIMPPWLAGEVAEIVGSASARLAAQRARATDKRPGSSAYYDAFEGEAALLGGAPADARVLLERALRDLGPGERLLRARVHAVLARSLWEMNDRKRAALAYEEAMLLDPGVFRRLGWAVPVKIEAGQGEATDEVIEMLLSSPRFFLATEGLSIRGSGGDRLCLMGGSDAVLACASMEPGPPPDQDTKQEEPAPSDPTQRVALRFLDEAFAPRIDLSEADIGSLDGSTRVGRDVLEEIGQ